MKDQLQAPFHPKSHYMKKLLLWGGLALLCACAPDETPTTASIQEDAQIAITESAQKGLQMRVSSSSRLSSHFQSWLNANGYGGDNFANGPSYGGRSSGSDPGNNHPVIFIHGNSDDATGWDESIDYFRNNGYRTSELYAITWGPASASQAANQYHSYAYLTRVRRFIQAVKAYTGASKVDVIGHSMGVTLCRKAIKGGAAYDAAVGGNYNLGSRLSFVDTFVGIAGGNL
ncbi:MAG TPA: lipase, partial [Cytophagales bacterium]|nr:lipase [Cytophagales bacterium]